MEQAYLFLDTQHKEQAKDILERIAEESSEVKVLKALNVLPCCYIEKYAAGMQPLSYLQFQRIGYFNVDKDSTPEKMVFNRTVGLKDVWGKINK